MPVLAEEVKMRLAPLQATSDHEGYGDSEGEGLGGRGSGGEDLESKDSSDSEGSNNEGNPAVKVRSQAVGAGAAAVPLSLMEKFRG